MDFTEVGTKKKAAKKPKKQVSIANLFNIEKVKKDFKPYSDAIQKMVVKAKAQEVKDDKTVTLAVSMAGEAKKLSKKIEKQGADIILEPNNFVKSVRNFVKTFTVPLKEIETDLKRKIGSFQYKKELKRKKQEEEIRKANVELQKKLDKEAKESGIEAPVVTQAPLPKQDSVVRSDSGASSYIRKTWKGVFEDVDKVPREYCSPDMKKINEAIKAGIREIPGVRIFQDIQTSLRT